MNMKEVNVRNDIFLETNKKLHFAEGSSDKGKKEGESKGANYVQMPC